MDRFITECKCTCVEPIIVIDSSDQEDDDNIAMTAR